MANLMLNEVRLCGRLCDNPELMTTPAGVPYTVVPIAVQRRTRSTNRETDFFRISLWRNSAETVCRYIKKGQSLYIEAELRPRSYLTKTGERRYEIEIVGKDVRFVDSKKGIVSEGSFNTDDFFAAALKKSYEREG